MSLGKCLVQRSPQSNDFETLIDLGKLREIKMESVHANFFSFYAIADLKIFSWCNVIQQTKIGPYGPELIWHLG